MDAARPASKTNPSRERELFLAALDCGSAEERAAFLDRECGGEPGLRGAVESLLALHREDSFLEVPALVRPDPRGAGAGAGAGVAGEGLRHLTGPGPGDMVDRYKLLQQIGEGGAGAVFMAEQESPVRRRVALKLIRAGMDTKSFIARFETERQALALMDHPNIAKVFDAGATPAGRPYFVMELVRGTRITTYCDEQELPTQERLRIFIKVCQAIQHAHQKGIIHRDIKPSNILVTLHDGVPVPKVIDFGIAKAIDHRLTDKTFFTEFQAFLGTPAYMSPEQAEMSGLDVDTRTDVYSLGVLLYEILTGRTPFDAQELLSSGLDGMRRTIREQEPVAPSTRLRTLVAAEQTTTAVRQRTEPARLVTLLHGDLDWIVLKALEKDRTRRYETASDLAQDVERYLRLEPVLARPPSTLDRLQKLIRRNRLAVVAVSAFAVALVLGLVLTTWQYLEKSAALRRAQKAEQLERGLREAAQRAQAREISLRQQAQEQEARARQRAYAADINLAQDALAANNVGRARELLDHHRPADREPDLRGWEWRHLWLQCRSDALFSLKHESNEVATLSISADGHWLATGTTAGSLSVTDLRTRSEVLRVDTRSWVRAAFAPVGGLLAFSDTAGPVAPPGPPGRSGGRDRLRLWDSIERRFVRSLPLSAGALGLAFSSDGSRLAVVTSDRFLTTWEVATGEELGRVELPGLSWMLRSLALSLDLQLVAYPVEGGRISVFDLGEGRSRWTVKAADEAVVALAFSPDGRWLASSAGFVESTIRLWDVAAGTEIDRFEGHRTWVAALLFWPDGSTLASASADQTIRLWGLGGVGKPPGAPIVEASAARPRATLRGHTLEVWSLALAPDSTTLVSGSKDGVVNVWDTTTRRRDRSHFTIPTTVTTWVFAADSRSLLTLDAQGAVVRWQGEDFQDGREEFHTGQAGAHGADFSPSGRFLVLRRPGRPEAVWDVGARALAPPRDGRDPGFSAGFLINSDHLVTWHPRESEFVEWDLATGQVVKSWPAPFSLDRPGPLHLSPDGQWVLVSGRNARGRLVHLTDGAVSELELGHGQFRAVAFSPDGHRFGWVSGLGTGELWSVSPARRTATVSGFLQGLASIAFSPDSRRAAIGSDGREALKLWDVGSGNELVTLAAEGSGFRTTAFSPDGNLLGSANSRGQLHLWRAPSFEEISEAEAVKR